MAIRLEGSPILSAVALPGHVLYVPPALWAANLLVSFLVALVAGAILGGGIRFEFLLVVAVVAHVVLAIRYLREPFVARLFTCYLQGRPVAPRQRTRSRERLPGAVQRLH
ncbi:hypothetical protein SAMN06265365_1423 [Tistlia consotensis]|uniref:Uncharacterized protein n=1 Tax=Tistlia consotensis USBA 355 TaxID=560819 RepID=A0A1Y6CQ11_9PROT|nr:hypothetical protein [Tistlia consotensis]SMF81931.1 hypothetical protein SAMN05428998_1453 [Tistlia consotensis USBA 355]SNS24894.1 hypothetical protein SAMN06265365_1423 [Tistlia consotensis]